MIIPDPHPWGSEAGHCEVESSGTSLLHLVVAVFVMAAIVLGCIVAVRGDRRSPGPATLPALAPPMYKAPETVTPIQEAVEREPEQPQWFGHVAFWFKNEKAVPTCGWLTTIEVGMRSDGVLMWRRGSELNNP